MTLDEIKALIEAMSASDLVELEVSKDGWTLRLVRHGGTALLATTAREARPVRTATRAQPGPLDPLQTSAVASSASDVRAPLSGIVHLGPFQDAPPFVTVGQTVTAGAMLCTVEAMKTFNAVTAEYDGVIETILVTAGEEVAAGQPLFRIV